MLKPSRCQVQKHRKPQSYSILFLFLLVFCVTFLFGKGRGASPSLWHLICLSSGPRTKESTYSESPSPAESQSPVESRPGLWHKQGLEHWAAKVTPSLVPVNTKMASIESLPNLEIGKRMFARPMVFSQSYLGSPTKPRRGLISGVRALIPSTFSREYFLRIATSFSAKASFSGSFGFGRDSPSRM